MLIERETIQEGEREWLRSIHRDLLNVDLLNRYSTWLAKKDTERSAFIVNFSHSIESNFTILLDKK